MAQKETKEKDVIQDISQNDSFEADTKYDMMSNIKDYSKVYYLHRNDVRYKKILRGAKKYFMDALQKQTNFSNKDRNASDRLARIQNHITQY